MIKLYTLMAVALLALASCDDLFDYHPYDTDVDGEKGINAKNIVRIEQACKGRDTIRFVMMGDSHRSYDEEKALVKSVNRIAGLDFLIHGGDFSEYGVTKEFEWHRDILSGLNVPYVALIGNHDCMGDGEYAFKAIFGEENFSFVSGNVRFVCLNTNAFEYDYSNPVPNFGFIEECIMDVPAEVSKHVAVMHAPPYSEQFNNNVAKVFEYALTQLPGLQFCLHAHCHKLLQDTIFDDGIVYYGSDCVEHRNYLLFTIKPDGYEYEVVYF